MERGIDAEEEEEFVGREIMEEERLQAPNVPHCKCCLSSSVLFCPSFPDIKKAQLSNPVSLVLEFAGFLDVLLLLLLLLLVFFGGVSEKWSV